MNENLIRDNMENNGIDYDTAYSLVRAQESIHKAVSMCNIDTLKVLKKFHPQLIEIAVDYGVKANLRSTFE